VLTEVISGALPFGEDDAEVFYGRERVTTDLMVHLARQLTRGGLAIVTGPSGAGKSFSPDGKLLAATGSGDGTQLWSVRTHREIGKPMSSGGSGDTVAFSPDGRLLATSSLDGTAELWNVATRRPAGGQFGDGVNAIAFSPAGQTCGGRRAASRVAHPSPLRNGMLPPPVSPTGKAAKP
jgi:WD40 repeat protein